MRKILASYTCCLIMSLSGEASAFSMGLVAYYPFSGGAQDESGLRHDGTVNGAVLTADRFGTPNEAFLFDGIDDFIQVEGTAALQVSTALTLAAWVRHDYGRSPEHIVNLAQESSGYRLAAWRGNPVGYALEFRSGFGVADGVLPPVGVWTHVVGTFDGITMRIYRDGILMGTRSPALPPPPAANDLFIGVLSIDCCPRQGYFAGAIDDVRIYNRALSSEQVAQLYQVPEPGSLSLLGFALAAAWLRAGRNKRCWPRRSEARDKRVAGTPR